MPADTLSRRSLLKASPAVSTAASWRRAAGANGRVRLGVIGTGPRGQYLMREVLKADLAQVVAVCDVYDVRRRQAAQLAPAPVAEYADHRRVLDHNDIDAVIVATPDHWHASITIDACRAGKDVYCEKPLVHTPEDGQAVVRAVRAHRRILQVGTQGRGMKQNVQAREEYVLPGILGKVGFVRTWYHSNAGYIQQPPPGMERKPDGLDWERWLGPGPRIPWNPAVYFSPYKWLHYDGGMIMGIGIHVVDTAHFLLGLSRPLAATATGGIYHYEDGRDTPDVITGAIEYPEKIALTFEAECLSAPGVRTAAGLELRGTGGVLTVHRYQTRDSLVYEPNARFSQAPPARFDGVGPVALPMLENWIDCIRTRRQTVANEEAAYWSTLACFMMNRAWLTRTRVEWRPEWDLPA
jgi:predicted dehydrogenase